MPVPKRLRLLLATLIAGMLVSASLLLAARHDGAPAEARVAAVQTPRPSLSPTPPPPALIAFARVTADGLSRAQSVRPGGTGLGELRAPGTTDRAVSSSGRLVYSKTLPGGGCGIAGCFAEAGIAITDVDGSNERLLTKGGYDTQPSFSPDGSLIMYLRHVKVGTGEPFDVVAFMTLDGTLINVLTPPKLYTYLSPVWAPDGRTVAVVRSGRYNTVEPRIDLLPVDGSKPRTLIAGHYFDLAWSHDGTRIAAVRSRRIGSGPGAHTTGNDLWVIHLDGSSARNVTHLAPAEEEWVTFCRASAGPSGLIRSPVWSPDDRQIAFLSSYRHLPQLGRAFDVAVVSSRGSRTELAYRSPPVRCLSQSILGGKESKPEQLVLLGWV